MLTTSLSDPPLAEIRRTPLGFILQRFNLIKGITVLDNVISPVGS